MKGYFFFLFFFRKAEQYLENFISDFINTLQMGIDDSGKHQNLYEFSSKIICKECGGTFRRQKISIGTHYEKIQRCCITHIVHCKISVSSKKKAFLSSSKKRELTQWKAAANCYHHFKQPGKQDNLPMICRDLKEALVIFDQWRLEIDTSVEGLYFSKDLIGIKARERFDIQAVDTEAFVWGEIDTTPTTKGKGAKNNEEVI